MLVVMVSRIPSSTPTPRVKPRVIKCLVQVMKSTAAPHCKGQQKDTAKGMLPYQQHP